MKLFYSARSPFVRKVMVVAKETGLENRIEPVTVDPWKPDPALVAVNPLGKVPALITDDGFALYDSPVICEYLDGLHSGPDLVPHQGMERLRALRLEALADGIAEAAVLRRMEITRPDGQRSAQWAELQARTVDGGLDALEKEVGTWTNQFKLGQIAVACALGYLDFRFAAEDWRATRGGLAEWYARVSQRPSLKTTEPRD
jgi:glutathione S-transferase